MTRTTHTSAASDPELAQACSTAQVLDELQLYSHHLHDDEPDPRPLRRWKPPSPPCSRPWPNR